MLVLCLQLTLLVVAGCVTDRPAEADADAAPAFRLRPVEASRLRVELLDMAERDRFVRTRDYDAMRASERSAALALWERTDRENTERLRRIVTVLGWPTRADIGEDGTRAAFLLLQHADIDPQLQEACLPLVLAAGDRGEIPKESIAYFTDRVLARQGKPQIYGTVYSVRVDDNDDTVTDENGRPIYLLPIVENPERLDERRLAMGLRPWAEYEAEMARTQDRPPSARPRTAVVAEE